MFSCMSLEGRHRGHIVMTAHGHLIPKLGNLFAHWGHRAGVKHGLLRPVLRKPCVLRRFLRPMLRKPCVLHGLLKPVLRKPYVLYDFLKPMLRKQTVLHGFLRPMLRKPCVPWGFLWDFPRRLQRSESTPSHKSDLSLKINWNCWLWRWSEMILPI